MGSNKKFIITEIKELKLSGWGSEYGAIEKIFFDADTPTNHFSSGITICKGKSKIPLHYHNCETYHYILYGTGIVRDIEKNGYELKQGVSFYCGQGKDGAHTFENKDDFPLAILWVHAYPKGLRETTTWLK